MKTRKLFFGLLAALAIAGCSSEENITADNGQTNSGEESHYLSVNILSGDGTTKSRADYEDGTNAEHAVKNIRFYFFKSDGTAAEVKKVNGAYQNFCDVSSDLSDPGEDDKPNVEKVINAVVVLNYASGDQRPAKMAAVVNIPSTTTLTNSSNSTNLSLSDLQSIVDDYSNACTIDDTKYFLMTSSVYVNNENKEIVAADLTDDNLQQSEDLAKKHPVDIYVERVVAKVRFNLPTNGTKLGTNTNTYEIKEEGTDNNKTKYYYIQALQKTSTGTEAIQTAKTGETAAADLYIKLLGWNVTATTDKSYLFKKVQTSWDAEKNWGTGNSWTQPALYRSFWAENPSSATINVPTIASNKNETSGGYIAFDKVSIKRTSTEETESDLLGANAHKFDKSDVAYVQENAGTPSGSTDLPNTKVIIAAQLCTKSNDGSYSPASIYEYADNRYTDSTTCKQAMINAFTPNVYTKVDNSTGADVTIGVGEGATYYKRVTPADLELVSAIKANVLTTYKETKNESYKSYLQVPGNITEEKVKTYYSITNGSASQYKEASEINEALLTSYVYANVYDEGYCYYYFDIQHLGYGVSDATFGQYGVVRNHIYECVLDGIYGLGTPVPDPTEIIVPEKPSDDVYVAAKINILSWRIVKNNITLEW